MARIKHGNFEFDDTQALTETLDQHARYLNKEISEKKEKEFKEREGKLKETWNIQKDNELFASSIDDEANRKVVNTLLEKGINKDDIIKEFPHLIGQNSNKPSSNEPELKTIDLNSVLSQQAAELQLSLDDKPVKEMTDKEKEIWILNNAKKFKS